jgi:two-component system, sensor histidine kinase and response regulator
MSEHVVLLVAENRPTRDEARAALASSCRLVEAGTVSEGLEQLCREPVDLVLIDVVLPGLHLHEACQRFKGASAGALLPVLLLSSLSEQADRINALEAGADDVLATPVDARELVLRVQRFLRLRDQDRAVREQNARLESLLLVREELGMLLVHDINNPLSSTKALLAVLRDEVPLQLRDDVELAALAAQRAEDLLQDLLFVNMLEAGEMRLERHPQPVATICDEAVRSLEGIARQFSVRASVRREADPRSSVDDRLLRRAVENMLANAYRYSPQGGEIDVWVRAREVWCLVDVADRGPGVPDAYKDVLFRKFGSVEARKGMARRGHGLGLHFVRQVAETHGGFVSILDRPGGGAIFRLSLPGEG